MSNRNIFHDTARRPGRRVGIWKALGVVFTAAAFLVMSALPAWAADMMTVTFIRHGESEGNSSGLIDTSTPGPSLTANGQAEAQAIANQLSMNNYDGIFASTMVRTQQTAAPMSQALQLPVTVLPGLQEIEAGVYEGTPEANAVNGYLQAPIQWVEGNLGAQIPGSITGTQFEDRFNGALQTIYDTGDRNPVVFSHGGAIMFWVMMNVTNLTLQQKFALFASAPLSNTNYVVVQGDPTDGWTLVNWNGQVFGTQPTPADTIALNNHTLAGQLSGVVQSIQAAFASGNVANVLNAISKGIGTAAFSVEKYVRAVGPSVQKQISTAVAQIGAGVVNGINQLKTNVTNVLDHLKPAAATTPATTPATGAGVHAAASVADNTTAATKTKVAAVTSTAAATGGAAATSTKKKTAKVAGSPKSTTATADSSKGGTSKSGSTKKAAAHAA